MRAVHGAYDELVARYGWQRIQCAEDGWTDPHRAIRSIEAIGEDLYKAVKAIL